MIGATNADAERAGMSEMNIYDRNPADTALRFERYLGISAALLIRLQAEYDLSKAVADKGPQIKREVLPAPKLAMA